MAKKKDLDTWVRDALLAAGGAASVAAVAKYIWQHHEAELRRSSDLFYTWQYDMRWAANRLRRRGTMKSTVASPTGVWELSKFK